MTRRRWLVLGAAAASILVIATSVVLVWSSRNGRFEPSAQSYLELACGLHHHQRHMTRAEIEHDEAERELAYAVSDLLLEVGNRKLDKRLQDLSDALGDALDKDDDKAFDATRRRIDRECVDNDDEFSPEPEPLVGVTCAIGDELKPGPGQEVQLLVMSHLAYAAADKDEKYDALAKKTAHLVIPAGQDPTSSGHPTKSQVADFHQTCRAVS